MYLFNELKEKYNQIFYNINGYNVSLNERNNNLNNPEKSGVLYGETPFELFFALMNLDILENYLKKAKVFYDLGSGIGNLTISAYMIRKFEKCCGVELLDSLYSLSTIALERFYDLYKDAKNKVSFIHDNMLNVDISDADIIYFSCPSKDDNFRYAMEEKFKNTLKSRTIIMSLIHVFKNKTDFDIITSRMVRSAWGQTPMVIYKKK